MNKFLFLLTGFLFLIQVSVGQNVTEWRNISRNGIYPEKNLLENWPAEGLKLLWSVTNLPSGYASMSVVNKTVYITGTADGQDILAAFDSTGAIKWQTAFGRAWNESFPESRTTPTIEENRAYVISGLGDIACIDIRDGKIIWSLKASEKFEGTYGIWGISESPVILDDKLFFTPGGEKTTVVALNKFNGETIWMSESLREKPSYVSPNVLNRQGVKYLIEVTAYTIFAVEANSGKIAWKYDFGKYARDSMNIHCNTPLINGDKIYVTSGYDHKSVMLQWLANEQSASVVWFDSILDVHIGGAVWIDGYIYGSNWQGNGMGHWCCIEASTGKIMYQTKWNNKGSIISDGKLLYVYEEKGGNIGIAKVSPEKFEIISSFKIPLGNGPHWGHPVINQGILYVRHGSALMAFSLKKE